MFRSHRVTALPRLGASLETHALLGEGFRVHAVRNARVISEDEVVLRAFDRKGHLARPVVTVVLAGEARLRVDGVEWRLGPGQAACLPRKARLSVRQSGSVYAALVLEWQPGLWGEAPSAPAQGPLTRRELEPVQRLWTRLVQPGYDLDGCAGALAEVLVALGATGLVEEPVEAKALAGSPEDPRHLALGRALDAALSDLSAGPGAVDLEAQLGLGERQVRRSVAAFNRRFGFNAAGWRDARDRRRLMAGTVLMTAPGATTERVARGLGYSSPTCFCRSMARVGLPSPGAVSRAVADAA